MADVATSLWMENACYISGHRPNETRRKISRKIQEKGIDILFLE
jgi:hypothetical protein